MEVRKIIQRLSCIFVFLCICPGLLGQAPENDKRYDSKNLYESPSEIIPPDEIQKLQQDAKDLKPEELIQRTKELLDRYNSQFAEHRFTQPERRMNPALSDLNDPDSVRLLVIQKFSELSNASNTRDSPILFQLHNLLADSYEKLGKKNQAITHYLAALQFRNLGNSESLYLDESRWKEIGDAEADKNAQTHRKVKTALEDSESEMEKAKQNFYLIRANAVRSGKSIDASTVGQAKSRLESAQKNLELAQKNYETSIKENLEPFQRKKARKDAELIVHLARLVKWAENENKERLKVVNRSTVSGEGVFVLFDYKRNTHFPGFESLMELANRIDPSYPDIAKEVAESLEESGKYIQARDYYQKYEKLLKEQDVKLAPADEAELNKNLAILETELGRNVQAASYYEMYWRVEPDSAKKSQFAFELGSFFEDKLGNLVKANQYYSDWLTARKKEYSDVLSEEMEERRMEFLARYGIAKYWKSVRKPSEERKFLMEAYSSYEGIRKRLDDAKTNKQNLEKEILDIKKQILRTENEEIFARYRIRKLDLEDLESRIGIIETKYHSIPSGELILDLSESLEKEKEYEKAKEMYSELVSLGDNRYSTIGLQNIKRINKILEDAQKRRPIRSQ